MWISLTQPAITAARHYLHHHVLGARYADPRMEKTRFENKTLRSKRRNGEQQLATETSVAFSLSQNEKVAANTA